MKIEAIQRNDLKVAEVVSEELIITDADSAMDLLGNLSYQGFGAIIIYEAGITPRFFDLKNGLAGEILQKFSNYRMRLAIVGDFKDYTRKSIQDFMAESNRTGHIIFVPSRDAALARYT